ncbi:hypothetical protein VIGAN_01161200, partial [Vigna angularis var. angularis]
RFNVARVNPVLNVPPANLFGFASKLGPPLPPFSSPGTAANPRLTIPPCIYVAGSVHQGVHCYSPPNWIFDKSHRTPPLFVLATNSPLLDPASLCCIAK